MINSGSKWRLFSLAAAGAMVVCAAGTVVGATLHRPRMQKKPMVPKARVLAARLAPQPELVAHLPFRGNARDMSGGGNHGTVTGPTLTADRFGHANCAYSLDGVDDYITLASEEHFDLQNLTIAMWVKLEGLPTPPGPFSAGR